MIIGEGVRVILVSGIPAELAILPDDQLIPAENSSRAARRARTLAGSVS
jgi:hypothetical protein